MCAITGNVETYNPATHRVEQRAAKEFAADPVKVESRQLDDILSSLARTNAEVSVLGSIPEHAKPAWLKVFERDPEYKEKLQAASYMTGLLPQLREAEKEGDLIRAAQLLGSYDAVSRWAENALSGDEAEYIERLRRRLDKAGVEIIPSAVNKPFTGDTPELRAASAFHDDALFPGETIVAACTAAGVRRRVIGMDPVVAPAEVTLASHTVRNPELEYGGRTFTPARVTVDREHGTVRIFTYDEPISGDSRQLGRELFPDLPDRKVYETEISIRAYDRMLQRAGWKYTFDEESGRRIWLRPEAEKEVADAIEKESRTPENKPSEPEAERAAEENTGEAERAPRETPETPQPAEPENAGAESPAESRRSESPQPPEPDEPPAEPAAPEKPAAVELKENDSVFIGGQETPVMFINGDGSMEILSVLPINEKSVEDNGRYYTTFPSREALENAADHRPDGSLRVIRDGKELLPESVQSPEPSQETSKAERPTQVPQEPGKYDRTVPQTREAQKTAISRVIDFARKVKDKIQRAVIAGITKRQSEDFAELGLDIDETWVHSFESSAFGHNQKEHGDSKVEDRRGQIAITEEDYARIPEILDSYDRVSKSPNRTHSSGNEVIIYEKEFDDGYVYYLEEKRDRRQSLAFQTMYKKKKGTDSSDGLMPDASPSTPLTPSDNLSSSSDRKVNTKSTDTQTQAGKTAAKTSETPRRQERPEAEPTDPRGLRDAADRAQRDIDALEKQIESHRAKEPSRLSAGTSYEEKHAKWQQRMDELQDQLPPLRELVLKWRAKADRLEQEQTEAEERRVIAEGGIPEDADGNWQFHKVTPEHTYRFLTERQGYTADDVIATADANIDAKGPKKPKLGANAKANAEKLQDYNRRLEEFNRNREYWQQVKEIAVRDKAEAEKAAEAARAEEIRRQEEERRRAEEAGSRSAATAVGREITDRWNGAEKIQGIEDAIITPSGRTIRGRYVLAEEGAATPSHDPETGFAKSLGFPVDKNGNTVNDRDYERDKAAQQYVHRVAAGYDGRAVQDPVIVSRDGVVLSGNNRTMSGRIAARDNTDAGYIGHLEATAAKYGFTAEQVRSMKHPRLYFETGENLPYTAETFALFNKTEKKEMNVTERSVKLGKTISGGVFNRMAREMDAYETFAEYVRSPEAVQAIKDLHAAGVIETAELPRYYDEQSGAITPEGVSLLQGALIGHVFSGNPDVVRMAMEHPAVRDSILKALVMLAENSRFSPEYSLIGDISRAIEIYHKGKEAGFRTVSESVLQHSLLEEMDIPETTALVIADLLNEGKTTRLQKFLKEYNAEARLADAGQLDIFSENAEPTPASEIRRQVYETLGINPKQYERYEKLRNNGKPDEPNDPEGPNGSGGNAPEPNGPKGGKPGGGGEPPQTPARPAGGAPQPGAGTDTAADPRITLRQRDGETSYQISLGDLLEAAGRPRDMFDVAKTASHWHFGGLYDSDGRGSFLFPDSERAEAFLKAAEQYPGDPQAFEKAARELAGRRDDGLFHKGEKYTVGEEKTTLEILSPRSLRGDYEVSVDGHKGIFKESQLQKILKPETDTPEASGPGHGSGSRPDLEAQGRRRDLAVEAKHARAKLRWNQKVLQQKEERLQKILDRDPAMVEIAEAFGDSMETMEAEARKEVRMASDEVEYARAQAEQREAELKAVRREIREGLKRLGIQEDRETDVSKARQIFDRHNTDPENAALMQRAADLAQSVGVKLIFTDRLPDGAGGAYDRIGIVKLPVDFLTEDFGRRYSRNILHEVIHSVTVYALETSERDLPEPLRKGARALKEIYAELRDDPDFKGEYGSKTALEMTAELSNPLFRAKLKAKKLWHRVVDSVKTMLGLHSGSAYDAASRALEKLLDNFDADLWREYRDQVARERRQDPAAERAPLNSAMATGAEEFRDLRERAVREKGIVMPGLADKEVRVVEVPRHPFIGEKPISQARRWAKGNIVGEHTLIDSSNREVPYTISGKAIEKYLSETAIGKSANTGVHLAVLTRLPEVISESIEAEVHPDYSKNNNAKRTSENEINGDSLIHRFYGAVEVDGETFRVKTTIIENGVAQKNKPHSYEVTAVELIEDAVPQPDNHGRIGRPRFSETQHIVEDESSSGNSISAAKLLKGIEKSYDSGKFLLEESEKASESPLVRFRDSETPLSGAEPAAAERNLVAVHNLTEENLADALGLGGFPMPSVAVTKAGMEHKDYGPVSLVFGRESIDPARRGNKVYTGDAWTPVFPETGYKLDGKKTGDIYGRANGAGALPLFKPTDFHPDNYERRIDRRGDRSLIESFRDSYSAKQLFLSEKGNPVTEMVQTRVEKYTPGRITLLEDIIRTVGKDRLLSESDDVLAPEVRGLIEKHDPSALEGRKPFVVKAKINNAILEAVDYAENGNISVKADTDATRAEIDKRVNQKEFEAWLSDMFSGVVEKKGIRNERDPFTPSGSSRPWEALYDEITLDNVVRAMRRQADKGGQGLFGSSIFGASTRELRDIDDVRMEAAARISSVPREEYEAEKEQIIGRLSKISLPSVAGDFSRAMDFVENVNEAVAKSHGADGIYRHLKGIYPDMTRPVAEEIAGIVADIQKMATRYLEAKPRRAVGLGEVRLAVVPEGTAPELVRQLESRGIPVRTYEPGNERQRADIISRETADRGLRFRRRTAEVQKRDSGTAPTPREARAAVPVLDLAVRDTRARLDAAGDPAERQAIEQELDQLLEEQDAYATGRAPQTPAQRAGVRRAAETTAAALGEKVIIHTTAAGITHPAAAVRARMRRAKGWYDAATGEVHINAFNHATEADVARTMLHESIGHKALRDFYGERFDSFLDEIYSSAEESIRRQIASRMGSNGWNVREATEEYLATLAETVDRHGADHLDTAAQRLWQRTKTAVKRTLNRILEKAGLTTRVNLTDRDLSYLLWRQYRSRRKAGALEAAENRVRLEALKADPESFAPEKTYGYEKTPVAGQPNRANEKLTSGSILLSAKGDSSSNANVPSEVSAKVTNNTQSAKNNIRKFINGDAKMDLSSVNNAFKSIGSLFSMRSNGGSRYTILRADNGDTIALRLSDHAANGRNFGRDNADRNVSIVIERRKFNTPESDIAFTEVTIPVETFNRRPSETVRAIVEGVDGLLRGEEFRLDPSLGTVEKKGNASDATYRFRDGDQEAAADPATAEETRSRRIFDLMVDMCNRNKDNVEYRDAARKTLTGRLATVARGMRLQRDFDRAQLAAVTDTCNKMIGLEILDTDSRADMARTIKAIGGSAGKEDLEDTAYRLLGIASHSQVRMARRRLDDLSGIRGTKTGDDRIQRQAGLDPEGQATAKAFRDFRKLPEQNIQTAMARVSERIAGDDVPESASMLAAAEMLGLRQALLHSQEDALHRDNLAGIEDALRDLKNQWDPSLSGEERRRYRQAKKSLGQQRIVEELRHADALGAIADSMGDTLQTSKERVRIFREAEKERVNNIHHDANCDMQGRPAHADKPARSKLVNNTLTSFFLAPTMTFDQMLRMFGKHSANGEGYLYYRFMSGPQGWQACEDRRFKSKQAKERILDRKAAEILGKDKAHWADLYKLTRAEGCTLTYNSAGVEVERKVSQGNLMYIYMANKMTDGAVKLRHMNITEEDMDLVEEVLDPRLRQLADWIQDEFLPSTRDGYNDVHIRMFGAPMDYVENYFPLKITEGEIQKNVEIGEMMNDGEGDTPKILTGAIRKRVFNTRALNILDSDPVAITLEHLEEMEDWAAFSEFRRDLGTLLSYRRFKNQVKNTTSVYGAGEKLWKRFGEVAQLTGGADQGMRSGMVGEVDKAVVNLCKLGTASRITYRVFTALKQFTSLPAFGSDTNLWNAIHSTATPRASWRWCMENLPSFEKRWVTRQPRIKRFQR